jgi:hypothetical protein
MLQMKNFLFVALIAFVFFSCDFAGNKKPDVSTNSAKEGENLENVKVAYYGKKIDESGAISGRELKEKMGSNTTMDAKVRGEIVDVCKKEGCWLTMDMEDGTTMQINMKDHAFFVPQDITGRTVIAEGQATIDSTSVEELKHYALDAGKSQAEIDAITDPETQLTFDAEGIIVK